MPPCFSNVPPTFRPARTSAPGPGPATPTDSSPAASRPPSGPSSWAFRRFGAVKNPSAARFWRADHASIVPLVSLKDRGIGIPDVVTSDAHEGLKAALPATLNASPWQRCQFHLQQNARAYVPAVAMRRQVAADIRSIFNCADRAKADERLAEVAAKYRDSAFKLSEWLEDNIPEGLTVFQLPEQCRRRLRSSNMSENLNKQIKRRARPALLPEPRTAACSPPTCPGCACPRRAGEVTSRRRSRPRSPWAGGRRAGRPPRRRSARATPACRGGAAIRGPRA
jgi:hypothetical protein